MPIYEYTCQKCGYTTEKLRSMTLRDAPIQCGECGSKLIRIVSRTSEPKFKGGGWTEKHYTKERKKND